jgi:cytochrome c-type biogenesis protein CcmH/NrfG
MKKETVILSVVIAFLVGFITGATVAILKGKKGAARPVALQPAPAAPATAPAAPPSGPSPAEVSAKIQALKDIVQKDANNLSALVELGNLYFDTDQPKEAVEAYSKYLAIKPDNADVRTDMGIMYRKLGDSDRAMQEFRKAAQTDPTHANSRYNVGVVLLHDKQDIKGAIKAWEDYLKADPNSERAERVKAQMERMRAMVK